MTIRPRSRTSLAASSTGSLDELAAQTRQALVHPVFFGSAITGAGVDALIHEFESPVRDPDGHLYRARVLGRRHRDGIWIGWLEFSPRGTGGVVRRTPRETTQPSEEALRYWASGLEPIYIEGAIVRAVRAPAASLPG